MSDKATGWKRRKRIVLAVGGVAMVMLAVLGGVAADPRLRLLWIVAGIVFVIAVLKNRT